IQACHDVSDGGLLAAVVEMALGRGGDAELGVRFEIPAGRRVASHCFAETPGYVCEVRAEDVRAFDAICGRHGVAALAAGVVTPAPVLEVRGDGVAAHVALSDLATVWRAGLRDVFEEASGS